MKPFCRSSSAAVCVFPGASGTEDRQSLAKSVMVCDASVGCLQVWFPSNWASVPGKFANQTALDAFTWSLLYLPTAALSLPAAYPAFNATGVLVSCEDDGWRGSAGSMPLRLRLPSPTRRVTRCS
jgi:hypothetical protein